MPFVPCPPNASVSTSRKEISVEVRTHPDGSVTKRERATASYFVTYGSKKGMKGKLRTIKGGRWAPCRSYSRFAQQVFYDPGFGVYDTGANRYEWTGYPDPGGIWAPTNNIALAMDSQYATVAARQVTLTNTGKGRIDTQLLIKAGNRNVNWGESLGESRSTAKMLAQSVSRLARAVLAARKGQFWKVAKVLRQPRLRLPSSMDLSRKWLAYQYGWKPLMGDIYDSYRALQRGFDTRPQVLSVTTRFTDTTESFNRAGNFDNAVRSSYAIQGKMWYRIADNWYSKLNQVGLINPAEVAWAVVPFSFVVDWFIPVSGYLEALSSRMGFTFVDGCYTVKVTSIGRKFNCERNVIVFRGKHSCNVRIELFSMQRTVMTSKPWPRLYNKSPFSTNHVTSALALLRQLWRR